MKRLPPMVTLRALREAHELTAEQLAERIDEQGVKVNPDSIYNVESGRKRASVRLLGAWARALRLTAGVDIFQADDLRNLVDDSSERQAS
jgi:transcriptional regulator with XRE-family HTH domain